MAAAVNIGPQAVAAGAAVLVVGFLLYRASQAASNAAAAVADTVGNAAQAVNPVSPENIFYTGVNAIGGTLAGPSSPGTNADGSWTLGGWIYDVTHTDPLISTTAPTTPATTGGAEGWW
ncbi:hypothetical protein HUU62_04390 [Rhodoferax sp. 4810]|nr:hypothetical protein [Rhodoferax jenense]